MKTIILFFSLFLISFQVSYAQDDTFYHTNPWFWTHPLDIENFYANTVPQGYYAAISDAATIWNSELTGVCAFTAGNTYNSFFWMGDCGADAQGNLILARTNRFSDQEMIGNVTYTVMKSCTTEVTSNTGISWYSSTSDNIQNSQTVQYDLVSNMLHEFGHWFDLNDNATNTDAVMYPSLAPNTSKRTLDPADYQPVEELYAESATIYLYICLPYLPHHTRISFSKDSRTECNSILVPKDQTSWFLVLYKNGVQIGGTFTTTTTYTDINAVQSLPATYVLDACAGDAPNYNSYSAPFTVTASPSTISSHTVWSQDVYVNSNVTIASNANLFISPGTTFYFNAGNGYSITSNGPLCVDGSSTNPVLFTSNSSTPAVGDWGSIILSGAGANYSSFGYMNMQYGTEIEALNTSNITIQNSRIQNCHYGFYGSTATGSILNDMIENVMSSAIMLNASAMDCKYNVIYKTPGFAYYNIGYGLEYFNGSTGTVYQNDIAGMNQGVNVYNRAWISSNGPNDNNKNNRITNCSEGLYVYYMSTAILGTTPNTGGQWNSIYGNGYNVMVGEHGETGSEVYAYGNWWGSYPPNTSLLSVRSPSTFYNYSPLNYDPWSGIPLHLNSIPSTPVIADNKSIDVASTSQSESGQALLQLNSPASGSSIEPLLDGIALLNQNRYNDAKTFFISYLSKHPDNQSAYVALYNCYNEETAPDIIKYFSSLPPQAAKDHKFLLSNLYLKQGKVDLAKGVNNSVIHDNPNTSLSERGKLNKMYIALDIDNNIDSASAIFTDILNSPNLLSQTDLSQAQERIETYAATRGKAKPNFNLQGGTNNSIPTTISLNNFPNPFNPTTNISYQLIENSRVSIKVYDILGRQVATLVDGNKTAGQYITVFDGSRYASGVYFVRMMVQGSSAQQIVKTLKIQMLK